MAAMSGVIRSFTSSLTTAPKAAPMTMPTARSTTFPRNKKALKPLIDVPPQSCVGLGETEPADSLLPWDLAGQRGLREAQSLHVGNDEEQLLQHVGAGAVHGANFEVEDG